MSAATHLRVIDSPHPERPKTWGECWDIPEEFAGCPWVSCRHHLYSDRVEEFADRLAPRPLGQMALWGRPQELGQTCSLAVARAVSDASFATTTTHVPGIGLVLSEGLRLNDVGEHIGASGERARQLLESGVANAANRPETREAAGLDPVGTVPERRPHWLAQLETAADRERLEARGPTQNEAPRPVESSEVDWFGGVHEW